uniref:Uncharacterized protein n=1 Tax=Arundo donax TaxID=35708 RepID=A0A0A9ACJ1_ARUDO
MALDTAVNFPACRGRSSIHSWASGDTNDLW